MSPSGGTISGCVSLFAPLSFDVDLFDFRTLVRCSFPRRLPGFDGVISMIGLVESTFHSGDETSPGQDSPICDGSDHCGRCLMRESNRRGSLRR